MQLVRISKVGWGGWRDGNITPTDTDRQADRQTDREVLKQVEGK